ncbi:MAG: hypothetical protein R2748_35565 [Bryobacterales bacterium]
MDKTTQLGPPSHVAIHAVLQLETIARVGVTGRKSLEQELQALHDAMDRDYETPNSDFDEDTYLRHINDEYIAVSEEIPLLFWYSQFLIGYASLEVFLNAICHSYQTQSKSPVSLRDIAGQGITRAQIYLTKVAGIGAPFQLAEWQTVKMFGEIRNAIAHRSGYIDRLPDDPKSLFQRLRKHDIELKVDLLDQPDAQIIIGEQIVNDAFDAYRTILLAAAGLGSDFVLPRHGTPSGSNHGNAW